MLIEPWIQEEYTIYMKVKAKGEVSSSFFIDGRMFH